VPAVSSVLLVAALALAVVIGPQTRPWTWGPAMLCLAGAALCAIPALWRRGKSPGDFGMIALGTLTGGWFAWRAWASPVAEAGLADLLLLAAVLGCFVVVRVISGNIRAERILSWGVALLLLASLLVVGRQMMDPGFSPVFRTKAAENAVTGFFGHYIDGSNFLVVSSMLAAAFGLFGSHGRAVRVIWVLMAICGIAGVWFTHSRGGILAVAAAGVVFAIALLILGKRRDANWFVPAMIAVPVIVMAITAFFYRGWSAAQEARQGSSDDIVRILDDVSRLYFLGVALSCVNLHPMAGGGSRSFSWECFQFVGGKEQGDISTHRPELVHNEIMQAATDYGWIGAGLLVVLIGGTGIRCLLQLLFGERKEETGFSDSWRLGAMAAMAGMLAQSCFSFVFHLLPGAMLLGIGLGMMSRGRGVPSGPPTTGVKILLTVAALAVAGLAIPHGWTGTRVTRTLWPTHYGKDAETSAESRIDALTAAIRLWPHTAFLQERAALFQTLAGTPGQAGFNQPAERALQDYGAAAKLHPFEPGFAVNRANILSQLGRDAEAEHAYHQAIRLQGGMEPGFRAHFSFAGHYLRKGLRLFDPGQPDAGHEALELAAEQIETAVARMHWVTADMNDPRVTIHENLGTAREAAGDREGALASYQFATKLFNGRRVHYRSGVLIGKMAVDAWSRRQPSLALKWFIEARRQLGQTGGHLPAGVTLSQSAEYLAYLERSIEFLKGAKVVPEP
jgi:tetratricopeptide (TPR) repeat protein